MLSYFKFEVSPALYAGLHGGEEKILTVQATIDRQVVSSQKIIPRVAPWKSEIEHYADLAVKTLIEELKKVEDGKHDKTNSQ